VYSATISKGGTSALTGYSPVSEFSFLPSIPPVGFLCQVAGSQPRNRRGRGLAGQDYRRIRILPARREPLTLYFFIQIFLGNIILRYLMRANFPLISAPGVFHARHYVSFERVSLFEQLVDTLRIRTLDVG